MTGWASGRRAAVLVAGLAAFAAGPVAGQETGAGSAETLSAVLVCHSVVESAARLSCYDSATGFAAGPKPAVSGAAVDGTPPETADPAATAAADGDLETRLGELVAAGDFAGALALVGAGLPPADVVDRIEALTLDAVRPIPAANAEANRDGYLLLAALRPDNARYAERAAHYTEAAVLAGTRHLRLLEAERDDFRSITFYTHPDTPFMFERSRVGAYIAAPDGREPYIRMETVYTAREWLFVGDAQVSIDGDIHLLTSGDFDRDNYRTIWEWRDDAATEGQVALLRRMATADRVVIRYNGDTYYDETTLTAEDKRILRDVLAAYDELVASR